MGTVALHMSCWRGTTPSKRMTETSRAATLFGVLPMPTFISLIRGINVSGQRKIRMVELKEAYEAIGLTNVDTYLQSGNVVFDGRVRSAAKVVAAIEKQILSLFGHEVTVMVRTPGDFECIVTSNPFSPYAKADPSKVHVTFLASKPSAGLVKSMEAVDTRGDEFSVNDKEIFLHCPGGYGKTKLNNAVFERKLGMLATTRNWRTVIALRDMAARC